MAWTSMHFAVGMAGGAAISGAFSLVTGKGWRCVPVAMTLGGVWALVPDMPRLWREDFPWLPFAATLGDKGFERWLHSFGDLFFFHQRLDLQPRELALHGLFIIIALYNAALGGLLWKSRRRRASLRLHTENTQRKAA